MYGVAHEAWIVVLSLLVAIQGCYVALGMALKFTSGEGMPRRFSLAAAACSFALSIWSMHFIGILAVRVPFPLSYDVLPTLLSFLVCAILVGVSVFVASFAPSQRLAVPLAGVVMGGGIATMHYVGMLALHHCAVMYHDPRFVVTSVLLAMIASTFGLRFAFGASQRLPLAAAAIVFGLAISGMHYVAMAGMRLTPIAQHADAADSQPALSPDVLAVLVSVAAFLVSAAFLLTLVPDRRSPATDRTIPTPQPELSPPQGLARVLTVERGGKTIMLPVEGIVMVRANAHYTTIFDEQTTSFCSLSIGEVEARLDPARFVRVHRSYLVAVDRIASLRHSGDGGTARVDAPQPVAIPVSRGRYSSVRARVEARA